MIIYSSKINSWDKINNFLVFKNKFIPPYIMEKEYEIIVFILFLYIFLVVLISYCNQQDQDISNHINNPLDDLIL